MKTLIVLAFYILPALSQAQSKQDTLYVYGPGGPGAAMEECAKVFSMKHSISVKVTAGPEPKWIEKAKQNADLVFGGAEYMLTQFKMQHPGLMDSTTRTELYKRRAGILVRPGNPKNITSLKDLAKPGINILEITGAGQLGMWEDLAGRQNLIGGIQKNIKGAFGNTAIAIDAWKADTKYDAIIIFASWHNRLKDVSELVEIPKKQTVYRGTPISVTTISNQKSEARQFIQFLLSAEGHAIFKKWGWE
ncbi:substrate-binding domain-containing protein [Daejeonella sp. JGW-45]|uniref:substrate-binding domain-containing protein n=1 Tax=Daejeonella sp. JGW-45 TaxID=3034148 RepID=UPI0023EC1345|nr:substrate-binding domain-containing protein [Daejeonella sp. JGW-45]